MTACTVTRLAAKCEVDQKGQDERDEMCNTYVADEMRTRQGGAPGGRGPLGKPSHK
jgi:hypothetical protein